MLDTARRDHEVGVIGMGAFSPLGSNCAEMRQALLDGRDSIGKVTHFDAACFVGELASSFGGDLPVEVEAGARSWMDRATLLTVEAYREAVRQAGMDPRSLDPERVGVCLGSSHSGLVRTEEVAQHVLGEQWERIRPRTVAATLVSHCTSVIKRMSGARGRVMTVSSACASSNSAVGIGADLIRRGELDLVVAGGSDTVSLSVMAGFNALRAISPARPPRSPTRPDSTSGRAPASSSSSGWIWTSPGAGRSWAGSWATACPATPGTPPRRTPTGPGASRR